MRFGVKELRSLLIESFDLEELHSLCFDLDINFDSLAGSTIDSKARELIAYCQRHLRLSDLLAACRQHGLQLAADVRKLLDAARVTALRKIEMQLIQEQL